MQPTILRCSLSLLVLLLVAMAAAAQEPGTNASPSRPAPTSGPYSWTVGPFAYDPSGNVATIGGSSYIYDPMSRLVTSSVRRPDQMGSQVNTYGYDVYGNRITVDGVATYAASAATNRLTGVGAVYDAAGNLTQWQPPGSAFARQYTYDALNMITNEVTGGQAVANIYTADDERLWRYDSTNNVSHWTVRDLGGKVLRDFLDDPNDSNGAGWTLYREYIYRNGQLLAVNTPAGTEHDSLDHLGSPRLVTDGNRNRIFHHHYLPFGGEWTIGNESVDGSTLRFTGHERDDDPLDQPNGTLDYMHARFYAANLGRFLSVDKHPGKRGFPQSWNRYSYALNGPVALVDPTGEEPLSPTTLQFLEALFHTSLSNVDVRGGLAGRIVSLVYGASSVTRGDAVYMAPDLEEGYERGDPDAIALMAHEVSHVLQMETWGDSMFTQGYLQNYVSNRLSGMNDFPAYQNIAFETAATAVQQRVDHFLAQRPDIARQLATGGTLSQAQLAAVSAILGQQLKPEDIRVGYRIVQGQVVLIR